MHRIFYTMTYTTTVASSSLKLSQLSNSKPSFKHKWFLLLQACSSMPG